MPTVTGEYFMNRGDFKEAAADLEVTAKGLRCVIVERRIADWFPSANSIHRLGNLYHRDEPRATLSLLSLGARKNSFMK